MTHIIGATEVSKVPHPRSVQCQADIYPCWCHRPPGSVFHLSSVFFRVYKKWETPRPESSMRPTFQKASEDLKQTSILRPQHAQKKKELFHSICFLLFLNSDPRAVEFFIRDKYEKKKYYSEKVTNGSSVCTNSFLMMPCSVYTIDAFCFPLLPFDSQRMLRRSGTRTEGAEPHPTAK